MAGGALAGLRVLECGDFVAAPYAAALLGHLGADVVKVEPPEGDSNRRRGPYPGGTPDPESGGLHLFLDQAKRGIVLDLETEAGRAELQQLARAADVLIASGPVEELQRRGLTYDAFKEANPRLVVTSVTPFGLQARDPGLPMREICDLAAGGWLSISPGAVTDPDLPPLKPFGQQAHFQAGIHAGIATLGALAVRERTGEGQQVDVSVEAVIPSQLEIALVHYTYGGRIPSRLGTRILGPWGMLQLTDGILFVVCVTEEEWKRLVEFLGSPDWADSPLFADRLIRAENNDGLLALLESELESRTVRDTYVAMQERRIPCAPVNAMADLLESPHLRARGFFVEQGHPRSGRLIFPGAPWQLSATPWQTGSRAPLLGEHDGELFGSGEWAAPGGGGHAPEPSTSVATSSGQSSTGGGRPPTGPAGADLPLAGIRVIDFTWAWAGPTCTMQLAHLGADVIRVESGTRPDTVRGLPPYWQEVRSPNRSGYFNQYSQGKRSLTLNLRRPEALVLAKELIRGSDVVVDNFSAGVLDRMGLGYEALRVLKPDIVQVQMAAHGQTGPYAKYVAYGPTQVPMIGLASLTGYPDGGPREVGLSYGDPNGGINAAFAILAALRHRLRTGEGQHIDMSQWEAAIPLVIEGLLTYEMTDEQPKRMGNRDQFEAPQGVFRCAGHGGPSSGAEGRASQTSDDRWLAISCWSDDEWRALAGVIGRTDLRDDAALATREGRKGREAELESAISAWTSARSAEQAFEVLRAACVPAFPVRTVADVAASPELAARGFWVELPHAECTGARHAGVPWQLSATPLRVRRAAPALGEHTDEVLRELLHQTPEQIARLRELGALE